MNSKTNFKLKVFLLSSISILLLSCIEQKDTNKSNLNQSKLEATRNDSSLSLNIRNQIDSSGNELVKEYIPKAQIYQLKKSHQIRLGEMWWLDKWPISNYKLGAFDLTKEIKGENYNEFNNFFLDSSNYDYRATTTLSPSYLIWFYNSNNKVFEEILLSYGGKNSEAVLIKRPYKDSTNQGYYFLTPKACTLLYDLLKRKI